MLLKKKPVCGFHIWVLSYQFWLGTVVLRSIKYRLARKCLFLCVPWTRSLLSMPKMLGKLVQDLANKTHMIRNHSKEPESPKKVKGGGPSSPSAILNSNTLVNSGNNNIVNNRSLLTKGGSTKDKSNKKLCFNFPEEPGSVSGQVGNSETAVKDSSIDDLNELEVCWLVRQ